MSKEDVEKLGDLLSIRIELERSLLFIYEQEESAKGIDQLRHKARLHLEKLRPKLNDHYNLSKGTSFSAESKSMNTAWLAEQLKLPVDSLLEFIKTIPGLPVMTGNSGLELQTIIGILECYFEAKNEVSNILILLCKHAQKYSQLIKEESLGSASLSQFKHDAIDNSNDGDGDCDRDDEDKQQKRKISTYTEEMKKKDLDWQIWIINYMFGLIVLLNEEIPTERPYPSLVSKMMKFIKDLEAHRSELQSKIIASIGDMEIVLTLIYEKLTYQKLMAIEILHFVIKYLIPLNTDEFQMILVYLQDSVYDTYDSCTGFLLLGYINGFFNAFHKASEYAFIQIVRSRLPARMDYFKDSESWKIFVMGLEKNLLELWKCPKYRAVIMLAWGVFLSITKEKRKELTFSPTFLPLKDDSEEDSKAATSRHHFVSIEDKAIYHWANDALDQDVLQFMNEHILARKPLMSFEIKATVSVKVPREHDPWIEKIHQNIQFSKEKRCHTWWPFVLMDIEALCLSVIGYLNDWLKELKLQDDVHLLTARDEKRVYFFELWLNVLGKIYSTPVPIHLRPIHRGRLMETERGLKFWRPENSLFASFLRWAAEVQSPSLIISYLELLSNLVGHSPSAALSCYRSLDLHLPDKLLMLTGKSGLDKQYYSGTFVLSWSHFWQSCQQYLAVLLMDTGHMGALHPQEIGTLEAFLKLLIALITEAPSIGLLLVDNVQWKVLPTLFGLLGSRISPSCKALLLLLLNALAMALPKMIPNLWSRLEGCQILPTIEMARQGEKLVPQGIVAEVENIESRLGTFPLLVSFCTLLETLLTSYPLPLDLGTGYREPGVFAYFVFVVEVGLEKWDGVSLVLDEEEKWRCLQACLRIFNLFLCSSDETCKAYAIRKVLSGEGLLTLLRKLAFATDSRNLAVATCYSVKLSLVALKTLLLVQWHSTLVVNSSILTRLEDWLLIYKENITQLLRYALTLPISETSLCRDKLDMDGDVETITCISLVALRLLKGLLKVHNLKSDLLLELCLAYMTPADQKALQHGLVALLMLEPQEHRFYTRYTHPLLKYYGSAIANQPRTLLKETESLEVIKLLEDVPRLGTSDLLRETPPADDPRSEAWKASNVELVGTINMLKVDLVDFLLVDLRTEFLFTLSHYLLEEVPESTGSNLQIIFELLEDKTEDRLPYLLIHRPLLAEKLCQLLVQLVRKGTNVHLRRLMRERGFLRQHLDTLVLYFMSVLGENAVEDEIEIERLYPLFSCLSSLLTLLNEEMYVLAQDSGQESTTFDESVKETLAFLFGEKKLVVIWRILLTMDKSFLVIEDPPELKSLMDRFGVHLASLTSSNGQYIQLPKLQKHLGLWLQNKQSSSEFTSSSLDQIKALLSHVLMKNQLSALSYAQWMFLLSWNTTLTLVSLTLNGDIDALSSPFNIEQLKRAILPKDALLIKENLFEALLEWIQLILGTVLESETDWPSLHLDALFSTAFETLFETLGDMDMTEAQLDGIVTKFSSTILKALLMVPERQICSAFVRGRLYMATFIYLSWLVKATTHIKDVHNLLTEHVPSTLVFAYYEKMMKDALSHASEEDAQMGALYCMKKMIELSYESETLMSYGRYLWKENYFHLSCHSLNSDWVHFVSLQKGTATTTVANDESLNQLQHVQALIQAKLAVLVSAVQCHSEIAQLLMDLNILDTFSGLDTTIIAKSPSNHDAVWGSALLLFCSIGIASAGVVSWRLKIFDWLLQHPFRPAITRFTRYWVYLVGDCVSLFRRLEPDSRRSLISLSSNVADVWHSLVQEWQPDEDDDQEQGRLLVLNIVKFFGTWWSECDRGSSDLSMIRLAYFSPILEKSKSTRPTIGDVIEVLERVAYFIERQSGYLKKDTLMFSYLLKKSSPQSSTKKEPFCLIYGIVEGLMELLLKNYEAYLDPMLWKSMLTAEGGEQEALTEEEMDKYLCDFINKSRDKLTPLCHTLASVSWKALLKGPLPDVEHLVSILKALEAVLAPLKGMKKNPRQPSPIPMALTTESSFNPYASLIKAQYLW